jgi:hypothetical protein
MIKIKLNRDEMGVFCSLTNPIMLEHEVMATVRDDGHLYRLADLFCLMELGEKAHKKFLFDHKKTYKVGLTWGQAAAFWNYSWNEALLDNFKSMLVTRIQSELHQALISYQRRYYVK